MLKMEIKLDAKIINKLGYNSEKYLIFYQNYLKK